MIHPAFIDQMRAILGSETAMNAIGFAHENGKFVTAICAAPTLLARKGIIGPGQRAVCYPGMETMLLDAGVEAPMDQSAVVCGKLITSQAPGTAFDFALTLLAQLAGQETADSVRADLHYRG